MTSYKSGLLLGVVLVAVATSLAQGNKPDTNSLIQQFKCASDTSTKFNILVQMARTHDDRVTRFLLRRFPAEKAATIRRQILWTLAQIGTKASAAALAELSYAFEEHEVSSAAKPIIRFLHEKGLLWVFTEHLVQKRSSKFATAQSVLAELLPTEGKDVRRSIKLLKRLLKSRSDKVRAAALIALSDVDSPDALKLIGACVEDKVERVAHLAVMILADRPLSDVMVYLLKALSSRHRKVVLAAIEAAKWGSSGELLKRLCALVAHKDGEVRQAAREALLCQQIPAAVGMLIERLRKAAQRKRPHFAEALKFLTKQDFGEDWKKWQRWWAEAKETFRMPPPPQRARATFFGTAVTSNRVIFVIDVSGSMAQRYKLKKPLPMKTSTDPQAAQKALEVIKIEMAKKELIKAVSGLPFDAKFNIVFYNHKFHAWRKGLQRASYRNKQAAINFVKKFKPSGRTNIYDTLMFALANKGVDTIYLLSDGLPNTGTVTDPNAIVEKISAHNRQRVAIHTFGFGLGARGRRFMEELAKRNRGRFCDM